MRKDIELDNEGAQQAHAKMVNGDLANQIYCDVDRDPNCFDGVNRVMYRFIWGKEYVISGYPKPDIQEYYSIKEIGLKIFDTRNIIMDVEYN